MGLNEPTNKTYLRVAFGKICKTVDADTPKAKPRVKKDGSTVYELIWESMSGILENVVFRPDKEYGNSWNLEISDVDEHFILQIPEDSRYGGDFLKKFPNMVKGTDYTFKPYDYEKSGKRKVGIWITETASQDKVESFYQQFEETKDGWKVTNLHAFPEFKGNSNDSDELKIYFLQVTKFLRTEGQKHLQTNFLNGQIDHASIEKEPEVSTQEESDGLPF